MAVIVQATTPTFIFRIPEHIDLSNLRNIEFSLTQGKYELNKSNDAIEVDGHRVRVWLSQSDTLPLKKGSAIIMLNWTYADGNRDCSKKYQLTVEDNLFAEIME